MTEHDNSEYRRFDEDMRRIEAFNDKANDPDQPLGALMQEYLEQVRPTAQRLQAQLGRWSTQVQADPDPTSGTTTERAEQPPDDDVPF